MYCFARRRKRPQEISIHALREEGDRRMADGAECKCGFLSTPSVRRATRDSSALPPPVAISIHALREEGDSFP